MGGVLSNSEYENWNTSSVNMCMGFLIARFDILEYEKTKKINPISVELYNHLDQKMEGFLEWYKANKKDNYKPCGGIMPMYEYNIINITYLMNKRDEDVRKIHSLWKTRDASLKDDTEKQYIRVEKSQLKSVPNDPMINLF